MTSVPKPERKRREFKRPAVKESVPLEEDEQFAVVQWLELHGIMFQASSMGLFMPLPTRMKFKKMGCKANHPDLIIYDRPPIVENGLMYVGAAIELKRVKGGDFRPEQKEYLEQLRERGWAVMVKDGEIVAARGAEEAISFLEGLGFGKHN